MVVNSTGRGKLISITKTPWGQIAKLSGSCLNTPVVESEVLLYEAEKKIEIRDRIRKELTYAKEAAYFAFPWSLGDPMFRFDIQNTWIDPEQDMLDGSSVEWFSPQYWINTSEGNASITLAILDAPLVCLGDINRGRWPRKFSKPSSTVFSYALNNYWFTNTPPGQSGDFLFRYAITSGPQFVPELTARFAREFRSPLEAAQVLMLDKTAENTGRLPGGSASLVSCGPDNVIITALKTSIDGKALIIRLLETAGRPAEGVVTLPLLEINGATEASIVEAPGNPLKFDAQSVRFNMQPHEVKTIRVTVKTRLRKNPPAKGE